MNRLPDDGKTNKDQEVLVLSGGFSGFGTRYKDDAALVANWDDAAHW